MFYVFSENFGMNTYGMRSITSGSFNTVPNPSLSYSRDTRNIIVTGLKIHNLVFDIMGYLPGIHTISGCVRMVTGVLICAVTLAAGKNRFEKNRWYSEALLTGIHQIMRGAFEALVPYGRAVNFVLGVLATYHNFGRDRGQITDHGDTGSSYHEDPIYPLPLRFLILV